jgi:hypothetical protein
MEVQSFPASEPVMPGDPGWGDGMDVDEARGAGVVAVGGAGAGVVGLDVAGVCWVPGWVPGAGAPPHAARPTMAAPATANGAINTVLMSSSMCRRRRPGIRPEVPFGVAKVIMSRPGSQTPGYFRMAERRPGRAALALPHLICVLRLQAERDGVAVPERPLGLAGHGDSRVEWPSHGSHQRVQFAVALAHDPDLLVFDEPFAGLDLIAMCGCRTVAAHGSNRADARGAVI